MAGSILVLENGNQLFVVLAQEANVDIVVPGNVTLVAHRTQERAVGKAVLQVILFTDALDLVQNAHLDFATFLLFNLFHL